MQTIRTTCGYCGCGCNMRYTVENNIITSVSPINSHPVSQGKLCAKGWQGHTFVSHKDRLASPLARNSKGELEPVTWEKAISLAALGLRGIAEKHGSSALGVLSSARCTNEENYLLARLARAALGTPNIDHCARL